MEKRNKDYITIDYDSANPTNIKVVGIGGGGGNTVDRMMASKMGGVHFIAMNTDQQVLHKNPADSKISLGAQLTRGLGAGGNPEIGRRAAMENMEEIRKNVEGADMVFVTAGMGGGTGTGAAPVVAEIAKELGILTVAVVTKPFSFEGSQRMSKAEEGIAKLKDKVDTLITIPNDRLLEVVSAEEDIDIVSAFKLCDAVLQQAVKGISDLIVKESTINLDFADIKSVMLEQGDALMGIGYGEGEDKTVKAVKEAMTSPLLEDTTIDGAKGVIISFAAAKPKLHEINMAAQLVRDAADANADIIWGIREDESLGDKVCVTVIATGLKTKAQQAALDNLNGKNSTIVRPAFAGKDIRGWEKAEKRTSEVLTHGETASQSEDWDVPTFIRQQKQQ